MQAAQLPTWTIEIVHTDAVSGMLLSTGLGDVTVDDGGAVL